MKYMVLLFNLHSLWAICGAWHVIFRRLSEWVGDWVRLRRRRFGFEGFGNFDPRLCLFRVCDNIVDATNLNDYVRELSLHFVVKLFVTTAWDAVNSAASKICLAELPLTYIYDNPKPYI